MTIKIDRYRHVIEMHCLYRTSKLPKVTTGLPITVHGILGKGNFNTLYFDTPDFDLQLPLLKDLLYGRSSLLLYWKL